MNFKRKPTHADEADFIKGATASAPKPQKVTYPWTGKDNKRFIPLFNVRLTESYRLKLEFIKEMDDIAKNKFVTDTLTKAIDEKVAEILARPKNEEDET